MYIAVKHLMFRVFMHFNRHYVSPTAAARCAQSRVNLRLEFFGAFALLYRDCRRRFDRDEAHIRARMKYSNAEKSVTCVPLVGLLPFERGFNAAEFTDVI